MFSSTQPTSTALPKGNTAVKITTQPKGRGKRKSKFGKPIAVAIASERTKKERTRKATKGQEGKQQRLQQQDRQQEKELEQERQMQILRMEQEVQHIALFQRQLGEQKKQEEKARKKREFHTHQRRLVQQQRLQEGQHVWKLEWQRQQPHLRELLRTEELHFQAQERLRPQDIPLSDMGHGEYLHDFAQPN